MNDEVEEPSLDEADEEPYVPTTEQVRRGYAWDSQPFVPDARRQEALDAFDRWLEQHDDSELRARLIDRQSQLLTKTVKALRGEPPELVWWSHHDIPELATAAVELLAETFARPLQWENVRPENKEHYLAQARQLIVDRADG